MRLFRRRAAPATPALPSAGHQGDDILLAQLASQSDLGEARHWIHFLYFADEEQARSAAEVIAAAGWQVRQVDAEAGEGSTWSVVAETQAVTSPETVRQARQFFEGVAATHVGGEYDGWEASL